jgi:hypothetical protein
VLLAALCAFGAAAQEAPKRKKPPVKKQPAAEKPTAHTKPTPEQIRKFNELQKKQK